MKTPNYNTRQQFETLLTRGRAQTAPEVNVRARVRAAINRERSVTAGYDEVSETLVRWFSGLRGGVLAGVVIMTVFLVGLFFVNQVSSGGVDSQEDGVTVFMDSGDWSDLI